MFHILIYITKAETFLTTYLYDQIRLIITEEVATRLRNV